jgi:predicted membrane protein
LSADWSGLVLRDGMAFAGTRQDRGTADPFYGHAAQYARSIYLDAILIGLLQLHGITGLENTLAAAFDSSPPAVMSNAVALFTLVTVPIGVALALLALLQLLGSHDAWQYAIVTAVFSGITAGLLRTRAARLVLRAIRRQLST